MAWPVVPSCQRSLLGFFRRVRHTGVLDTQWGRAAFESAYDAYKHWWESPQVDALMHWVPRGGR